MTAIDDIIRDIDAATLPPPAETRPVENAIDGSARRRELADFLRSRRERLRPDDVGLPAGRRRRTPGLRREEVAELAGIGVTWYTWMEQGRDIRASVDVIDAVAGALRLDRDERRHLYALAASDDVPHRHEGVAPGPQLRAILAALEPVPAAVSNARYDVLAWNRSAAALFADFDALAPQDRNLLWLALVDEAWRTFLVDYEEDVRRLVARFRGSMARHVGEPAWTGLVDRLARNSPLFRELWERHEVLGVGSRTKRFQHPRVGPLRLDHTMLWIGELPECGLGVWTPVDRASREAIERLCDPSARAEPDSSRDS